MRNRFKKKLDPNQMEQFKESLLNHLSTQDRACFLDSCGLAAANNAGKYDFIAAFGALSSLSVHEGNAFEELRDYHERIQDWIFGALSYDLKNNLHPQLDSENRDPNPCPLVHFFQPETIITCEAGELLVESIHDSELVYDSILQSQTQGLNALEVSKLPDSISQEQYIEKIEQIKSEIRDGNVYELNYCLSHEYDVHSGINPMQLFGKLKSISPAPFACGFVHADRAIICASPERYIRKTGNSVLSQPIKGTRPRGGTADEDLRQKIELQNSLKERAENVMIVDLVRNDLAHTCKAGSVQVSELFGIYSYEQVHQMVSTIEGDLAEDQHWTDIIRHSFPMGSMTGAPKIAAMQLIDDLENFKRGWYSGSVGYVTPRADFDFNVIIRSLIYNREHNRLTYAVGGAITYDSTADAEWDECHLKAQAIHKLLASLRIS
jgi:para-aminobenzoate synthetase component 1